MGRLEVICGPMFSGKSEELLRRLRRFKIAGKSVVLFKPSIDTRYEEDFVISHSGVKMAATQVSSDGSIFLDAFDYDVVGIDEVQFFRPEQIFYDIKDLLIAGKIIVVSGLDMTYRTEPFEPVPRLLAIANSIDKYSAICNVCGEDAIHTQRLHDGKPASFDEDTIVVGGLEQYEARCRDHFEIG